MSIAYDYAYGFSEIEMKYLYERIFEFVVDYVRSTGRRRGAIVEAARHFYPELFRDDRRKAVKRVWRLFKYALEKMPCRTSCVEFVEHNVEQDRIVDDLEYNMGYYVKNHSGHIREATKFIKDSRKNRKLFELKKMTYAILQDMVKPKSTLSSYVEQLFRDPRLVTEINRIDGNIWYNGRKYIKLPRRAAALLYLVVYTIYTKHYGIGNRPEKLIRRFFEVTGYGPRDLEKELRELTSIFYDWLLFL